MTRTLLAALLCLALQVAHSASTELSGVREEFARAYTAAGANDGTTDSESLRAYILYPYVEQARLLSALNAGEPADATDDAIERFLKAHDREWVAVELRRAWFTSLAKRQRWETFLANYRDVNDPAIQCYSLNARLSLQRLDGLQSDIVAAWSSAGESRPACDPVFTWAKSQGALTPAVVETRARVALKAGNAAFARQMADLLPEDRARQVSRWASLIERPMDAIDRAIANPKEEYEPAALLDGWIRLARRDPGAAMQRYSTLVRARKLEKEAASRYALELALALSWNRRAEALSYFARVRPEDMDDRGAEWCARAALWARNFKQARLVIESMSSSLRQQTKWRYWLARAKEQTGKSQAARIEYQALVTDDNYYASLAAARLHAPYTPQPKALPTDETILKELSDLPSLQRAYELLQIAIPQLKPSAYEEWRIGTTRLAPAARMQAVVLAARWHWYDQAILTAAQQSLFDDYGLLYPRPFDAAVSAAAQSTRLPENLIYGTLRQESLFRIDAQSAVGARGLMQLMPDTAKRTARRWTQLPAPVRTASDLTDPTVNILLGSAKLRDMVDRYRGSVPLALAAYNAGPGAAERWLPKSNLDSDIWIENIPYNETRTYVQRIFWHSLVFGWLKEQKPQDSGAWLTQIESSYR